MIMEAAVVAEATAVVEVVTEAADIAKVEDSLRDLRKTRSSAVALVATWPPSKALSWVSRPLVLRSVVPSVAPASTSVASPPRPFYIPPTCTMKLSIHLPTME